MSRTTALALALPVAGTPDVAIEAAGLTPEPAPGPGWIDRHARVTTILFVGRLIDARADHLCRIRNVSEGGMMIECDSAIPVGAQVRIEVRHGIVLEAEVVWVDGHRLGVRAVVPIDVRRLLEAQPRRGTQVPRSPRLSAAAAAQIAWRGRTRAAILLDISQAGCRIAITDCPEIDEPVRLSIPGLPVRTAVQRWVRDGQAGFVFLDPHPFAALSAWQGDYRRRFALAD